MQQIATYLLILAMHIAYFHRILMLVSAVASTKSTADPRAHWEVGMGIM